MSLKDEYVEKLKAQLDEWSADIDVLDAKVRKTDAELRIKYDEQVSALKLKREEAKVKLAEVQSSAGEAWKELRKGSDEAWESIKSAIAEARKKFNE
ncbi:hypothetical protein SAMN05192560_0613 [Methylobacillus rhizosphaerae]|uniref:Coiled coil domain-containing protein n=1 Tax=Methylobacillus rhizosphaerae TaxID=551994 RepID=A0A238YIU1_9PROT|nr:hypothetical protein [Methylobacillus rhizosphaerae]SNR70641.1 hypothetical protein SAMN05192560_0613 [Methylobacillus rhizosphaerae]